MKLSQTLISNSPESRRVADVLLVAGLIVWTVMCATLRRPNAGDSVDDGLYLVSAQSLRDGMGYQLPSQVGPAIRSRYSIGLPALIACALALAPGEPSLERDLWVGRWVILASAWIFAFATSRWIRRMGLWSLASTLAVFLCLFHPAFLIASISIMTDLPFASMVFLILLRCERVSRLDGRWSLVTGMLAGAAMTVRGNGVSLLLAGCATAGVRGRWKLVRVGVVLAGAAAVLLPAAYVTRQAAGSHVSGGYGEELRAGWATSGFNIVLENLDQYWRFPGQVIGPEFSSWSPIPTVVKLVWIAVVGVVSVIGTVRMVRCFGIRSLSTWVHVAVTLAIFLIWPWPFNERFGLSLFPIVILVFVSGLLGIARGSGLSRRNARRLASLTLLTLVCGMLLWTGRVWLKSQQQDGIWAEHEVAADTAEALNYIRDRLEPNAVIVSVKPEMVYMYTGHQGMTLLLERDWLSHHYGREDRILTRMHEAPGRPFYLLTEPEDPKSPLTLQVRQLENADHLKLNVVFHSSYNHLKIYRVTRSGAAPGTRAEDHGLPTNGERTDQSVSSP